MDLVGTLLMDVPPNKFLGPGCRHGHHNDEGLSLRHLHSGRCVECDRIYRNNLRKRNTSYAKYQAEYHRDLRLNHPEKLKQYRNTQVAKGNTYPKYYKGCNDEDKSTDS